MKNLILKFIQITKLYNYMGEYRAAFKDAGFVETNLDRLKCDEKIY